MLDSRLTIELQFKVFARESSRDNFAFSIYFLAGIGGGQTVTSYSIDDKIGSYGRSIANCRVHSLAVLWKSR